GVRVQVTLELPDGAGVRAVTVHSRPEDAPADAPWTRHASGTVAPGTHRPAARPGQWPPIGATPVPVPEAYERLAGAGLTLGPAFAGMRAAWRRGDELFAETAHGADAPDAARLDLHPALLDPALLALAPGTEDEPGGAYVRLAAAWRGVSAVPGPLTAARVTLRVTDTDTLA
ncbi:polyketide synthase dehydratase domain-containing protein, partial [Streptomyces sp. UNOC14_S4]|uniref:polyketide synthase dehydratase domain-containing protein n=1 Tax=Streptomyces sp. UNOC14_S4 TaxID=2872340 RepID=UPI001E4BF90C